MRLPSIAVIGAGVVGLTTGIELLKHDYQVTIVADSALDGTTSSVAAAFWYPFWTGNEPDHSWYKATWAWETFLKLDELVSDPASGITRAALLEYFDSSIPSSLLTSTLNGMWWKVIPRTRFEMLLASEVANVRFCRAPHGDLKFQAGMKFETLVINMSCYLEYLQGMFSRDGGQLDIPHYLASSDLEQLCGKYDFVVNCSGQGSHDLINDKRLVPKQGVVLHLPPIEAVRDVTLVHTGMFANNPLYVVPRGGAIRDTVLGGTITLTSGVPRPKHIAWNRLGQETRAIQIDAENILAECRAMLHILAKYEPLTVSVGYRPVRIFGDAGSPSERTAPVRLEPETAGAMAGRIVHNYGHGGGGVTLSWGCAAEVRRWIEWLRATN